MSSICKLSFFTCVFDADDLGRLWRNAAGGRLYAEPRTCRPCRRARRKPSSSRLRRFAVGCKHIIGEARGRGDQALNLGTLSKATSPVPRLKPPDSVPRSSRFKSSLRTQQQIIGGGAPLCQPEVYHSTIPPLHFSTLPPLHFSTRQAPRPCDMRGLFAIIHPFRPKGRGVDL